MSLENFPNSFLNFSESDVNGGEKHFYRFKSFRLDVKERQLLHHNSPVPLTPKAFDVLTALVERSGHLVEKDELLKLVWANSFVEEVNIARIVHTLRKTLGEDESGNKFIETVAKKGYRFVAKVTEVCETSETKPDSQPSAVTVGSQDGTNEQLPTTNHQTPTETYTPVSKPKRTTLIILFTVGFLSAICLIILLSFNFQSGSSTNPNKVKSFAVLPLKPIGTANRNEFYEVGIADSLILKLGSTKGFAVRPLSAMRKYTGIEQDPIAAGREQKVDYVLAANYQLVDGKIRITAQLFNVSSGQVEETYKIEKDANNIFAVQDAIAGEVGNKLLARFDSAATDTTARHGTDNEEAYRLYLQGKNLTERRSGSDSKKAVEYFQEAVRLDPNYALGYAGLASAFGASGNLGGGLPREEYEKAKTAVGKALELDENLAEAYRVRGALKFVYEWDFDGAEKDWLRAAELEPNSAQGFDAGYLSCRGRFDEALAKVDAELEIDPNSLALQRDRGRILYLARRYDEAILQLKRIIEIDKNFASANAWLWVTLEMKGDHAGAYEWFMKAQSKPETIELYQNIYKDSGWQGVLRKQLELDKQNEQQPNSNFYRLARYCALLGEKEEAFAYLSKALEKRNGQVVMLNVEPAFDSLRDDVRFDELVRRIGLK